MGRKANIVGQVTDAFGDEWEVKEFRPTDHGWPVAIGWPAGLPRGRGGTGGPRTILTAELVARLEDVRDHKTPIPDARLPVGYWVVKRLRAILGHDRKSDRRAWYEERSEDLETLAFTEFARKHGGTDVAAEAMYAEMFGGWRGKDESWWKDSEAASLLKSGLPASLIAERLGRTCSAVWNGRMRLKEWEEHGRE